MSESTDQPMAWEAGPGAGLPKGRRVLLLLGSSALLLAGSPGGPLDGALLGPLAMVLGLALWALAAARTGPWRKRLDWLSGFLYGAPLMSWVGYVTPPSVVWIGIGWGLYYLLAGVLLRRLLHHIGLPLAVGLSYTALESLRTVIPTPIGISWIRVGHALDELGPLRLAAAEVGVVGLGFLLAVFAGLVALVALRTLTPPAAPGSRVRAREMGRPVVVQALASLGLLGLFLALGALRPELGLEAPDGAYRAGPRVLLVQPGLPQERKRDLNAGRGVAELIDQQLDMTLAGLLAEDDAGRRVDAIAWGESMLPLNLIHPSLGAAIEAGDTLEWPTWDRYLEGIDASPDAPGRLLAISSRDEASLIGSLRAGRFLDPRGEYAQRWAGRPDDLARASARLAEANFSSGVLLYTEEHGVVRRVNGVAVWDAGGERIGSGWKWHLVPGAEGLVGLEEYAWARAWAKKLMPYVPDFRAATEPGLVELPVGEAGETATASIAVCFDNGFEDLFLESAQAGADFVLLASNEAWYVESHEFDQMIALSRLWAVESGRSIVRATNSGISAQLGPRGELREKLVVDGLDRAVGGVLAVDVVVPREGTGPAPYAGRRGLVELLAVLLPWLLLALFELLDGRREVVAAA